MKKFKAIFNRADGNFDFTESELLEELKLVSESKGFRTSTKVRAVEIINDKSGSIFFSSYDLSDPLFIFHDFINK